MSGSSGSGGSDAGNVLAFRRRHRHPSYRLLGIVLLLVVVSLLLLLLDFRIGTIALTCSVGLALVLRWYLPEEKAGLLVVRTRRVDVTVLLVLFLCLAVLAVIVPAPSS